MTDRTDLREFRRLREYYRRNFRNGESDGCFVNWCELMCQGERQRLAKWNERDKTPASPV